MADSRYTCSFCSKSFAQKRHRNRHMLNHKEAEYPCHYCKKPFHRKDVQTKHMKVCQQNPDIMEDSLHWYNNLDVSFVQAVKVSQ